MTKTERAKVKRTLVANHEYIIDSTCHILKHYDYYGAYYVLKQYNGGWQTVAVEYDINKILNLL